MKSPILSASPIARRIAPSHSWLGLALLSALAFLPFILHLVAGGFSVTSPLAALGPLLAGFWFAASLGETRIRFATLGTVVAVLLWVANWLMMASGCCATIR